MSPADCRASVMECGRANLSLSQCEPVSRAPVRPISDIENRPAETVAPMTDVVRDASDPETAVHRLTSATAPLFPGIGHFAATSCMRGWAHGFQNPRQTTPEVLRDNLDEKERQSG